MSAQPESVPPTYPGFDPDGPAVRKLRAGTLSGLKLRLFLGANLPLGLIAGLRVRSFDADHCVVTVPYRWVTTNPFRSTYFAALSMAAEMSTGALGLAIVRASPEPLSMLIVGMQGEFVKKATSLTAFRCDAGPEMSAAVIRALTTGEAATIEVATVGTAPDGSVVARFSFTWSFKKKTR